MTPSTAPRRLRLRKIFLASLLLVLTACSPPDQGRVVRDVALDADGLLVEIDSGENYSSEMEAIDTNQLSNVGQATEACLDDGTCIRIVDGRRIEESTDQWETFTTVWQIEPNASWWGHEHDDGWYDPVIGLFDVVVLPDQSVAVASGQLPIIERTVDGEWTPTVAELRTLPGRSVLLPAIVIMLLVAALASGTHHGARLARAAGLLLLPAFLTIIGFTIYPLASNTGVLILTALATIAMAPLPPIAIGLAIEAVRRAHLEQDFARRFLPPAALIAGGAIALLTATYLLWSNDRMSWLLANILWVLIAIGAIAALRQNARRTTPLVSATPPAIDQPRSLSITITACYLIGLAITAAVIVLAVAFANFFVSMAAGLVLWLGIGGWVCSTFATKVPYEESLSVPSVEVVG